MKQYKIGLKLFSTNLESLEIVEKLFIQDVFNYIELMPIPGSFNKTIYRWKSLNIPIVIHAPHSEYGFNLSDKGQRKSNGKQFIEVNKFANKLSTEIIIVHPGLTGEISETIWQVKSLNDDRIIVENMPYVSLLGTKCQGSNPDEIEKIMKETGCGFCLDIAHAVKAAFSHGKDAFKFIASFILLKPKIFHLCGIKKDGCFDEHLNLEDGDFDIKKWFCLVKKHPSSQKLTLEIPEKSYELLSSFQKGVKIINNLIINLEFSPIGVKIKEVY